MYQDLFSLQEEIFKVLANQKRLEIIQLLHGRQLPVNDMASMLGLRQANLSQHLSLLRQHRVVKAQRRGRHIYYSLIDDILGEAAGMIREFLKNQHQISPGDLAKLDDKQTRMYPITQDPVCGMRLSIHDVAAEQDYQGKVYHFCALGCHEKFKTTPHEYVVVKTEEVSG